MNFPASLLIGLLSILPASAAELFGTVEAVSGAATLTDAGGARQTVTAGLKILTGQSIRTAADGEVHIVTQDSGLIALRPDSDFRIDRYQATGAPSDEFVFSLFKGALRSITGWVARRNPAAYRLNTPTATIGVRGTDHETTVIEITSGNDQPGTFDRVIEGITVMQTPNGSIEIHPGEHAFAERAAGTVPRLLSNEPDFRIHRALKIEDRIPQRKEGLNRNVRHRLEERRETAEERAPDINQREQVKRRMENRVRQRRNQ